MWKFIAGVKNPNKDKPKSKAEVEKKSRDNLYDKTRKRTFQEHRKTTYPWLECRPLSSSILSVPKSDNGVCKTDSDIPGASTDDCTTLGMFCLYCSSSSTNGNGNPPISNLSGTGSFLTGCTNFHTSALRAHNDSKEHRLNHLKHNELEEENKSKVSKAQQSVRMLNISVIKKVKLLMRTAHGLAKQGRPFTDFRFHCMLDKVKGLDIGETYATDKHCVQFQKCIAEVERLNLHNTVSDNPFLTLINDGTTDSAVKEQEIMFVRSVNKMGKIEVKLLSIEYVYRADAASIMEAIEKAFDEQLPGIDWKKKLIGFGSDGAATMMGKNNGVAARLKNIQPELVAVHCSAHRLELAMKDMCKFVDYHKNVCSPFLLGLYNYYHNSSYCRSALKRSCESLNVRCLIPTRVGGTRWVGHTLKAVNNILHTYPGFINHLADTQISRASTDAQAKAKGFLKTMLNKRFFYYLNFLGDLLEILSNLSLQFQKQTCSVGELYESLSDCQVLLEKITTCKGPRESKIEEKISEIQSKCNTLFTDCDGSKSADSAKFLCPFEKDREALLKMLILSIEKRFEDMLTADKMIAMSNITNFNKWPKVCDELNKNYGDDDVEILKDTFASVLQANGFVTDNLLFEWTILKQIITRKYKKGLAGGVTWQDIFPLAQEKCPNILGLVSLILTLPASSADCERGFSLLKAIKSDWRSRLTNINLLNQMRIKLDSEEISEFNPERAIDIWWASGSRKRRPTTSPYGPRPNKVNKPDEHDSEPIECSDSETELEIIDQSGSESEYSTDSDA